MKVIAAQLLREANQHRSCSSVSTERVKGLMLELIHDTNVNAAEVSVFAYCVNLGSLLFVCAH